MMGTMSLSIFCASLYVLTLLEIPQVQCLTDAVLDMMPRTFDDQYVGCEEEMVEEMNSVKLLETEKNMSDFFKYSWENAGSKWKAMVEEKTLPPLPKGFRDEHGIALVLYTISGISENFNKEVWIGGTSPEHYMEKFHFKVLHFYLTTALRLLKGNCEEVCQRVYRGESEIHFHPSNSSDKIRLGQFTSTSTSKEIAETDGTNSFFTLMSCFGVCAHPFFSFAIENEVLLPVNEIFTVSSFDKQTHSFVLDSTREACSRYNCIYLEGPSDEVGITYPYCYSSAPEGGPLLFSLKTPQLFSEVFLMIAAVTLRLLSGF